MTALRDASVQDIHLELIRRTKFNAFDGQQVYDSLLRHRELWLAVVLDRMGLADYSRPGSLLLGSLIKLRDMPYNDWNADMLYVLTKGTDAARRMAAVAESEDWGGEVLVHDDQADLGRAVGAPGERYGLMTVWWD